ncbi:MAG TPA: hypothetical protein VFW66_11990 [Gemmatimonadales bacterium]|nr:hypothetical protein [Gemmatimonadales bacterium]
MTAQSTISRENPGLGADLDASKRPGIPKERQPPSPAEGAHWTEPAQQTPTVPIQKRVGLTHLTPVFGTMQPPHGLSGVLRKAAYKIPEHRAPHWLLLLVADRVDVVESGVADFARRRPGAVVTAGLAALLLIGAAASNGRSGAARADRLNRRWPDRRRSGSRAR